jgi:hypothetical protein
VKGNDRRMLTLNTDLVGGGLLVAIAAVALLSARDATFNVWIFPRVAATCLAAIGAGLVIKAFVTPERRAIIDRRMAVTTLLPFAGGLIAYGVLFTRAGFLPTTIVLYAAATWVLRQKFTFRSAALSLAIGTVFSVILHQVFTQVFYVPLPIGSWWGGR